MMNQLVKLRFKKSEDELIDLKELIKIFKAVFKVDNQINALIFKSEMGSQKNVKKLALFNRIKAIFIKCADANKKVNIVILNGLINELRTKLSIYKAGLGSQHIQRHLNRGMHGVPSNIIFSTMANVNDTSDDD